MSWRAVTPTPTAPAPTDRQLSPIEQLLARLRTPVSPGVENFRHRDRTLSPAPRNQLLTLAPVNTQAPQKLVALWQGTLVGTVNDPADIPLTPGAQLHEAWVTPDGQRWMAGSFQASSFGTPGGGDGPSIQELMPRTPANAGVDISQMLIPGQTAWIVLGDPEVGNITALRFNGTPGDHFWTDSDLWNAGMGAAIAVAPTIATGHDVTVTADHPAESVALGTWRVVTPIFIDSITPNPIGLDGGTITVHGSGFSLIDTPIGGSNTFPLVLGIYYGTYAFPDIIFANNEYSTNLHATTLNDTTITCEIPDMSGYSFNEPIHAVVWPNAAFGGNWGPRSYYELSVTP